MYDDEIQHTEVSESETNATINEIFADYEKYLKIFLAVSLTLIILWLASGVIILFAFAAEDKGGDDYNIKESKIGTRDKGDEIQDGQDTQDTNDIKDNSAHNDNTNEDHNNNNKAQGGKLTIHLELKYKTWQKTDPQRLGKFTLVVYSEDHNSKKIWKKDIYLDNLPKSYDVKKLAILVGNRAQICLSSYERDEGNCDYVLNHPKKAPEIARVVVP